MPSTIAKKQGATRSQHPYLSGNFAPVRHVQPLNPCNYEGYIPDELIGGQYVRNGSNPVIGDDANREAHWFDGDGMLTGVWFRRLPRDRGQVQAEFVNQYVLTDIYLSAATSPAIRRPIMTSIAKLVDPNSTALSVLAETLRTILLIIISYLPGSRQAIKRISVANTAILYHDGRALATCESGPPIRVALPGLETVGWFNGIRAEGESRIESNDIQGFGGTGLLSFMKEWTTGHPRKDPITKELILFHPSVAPPYVEYSIIPPTADRTIRSTPRIVNSAVPGVSSPKMMHDFGVSRSYTVIMDLPLSLTPLNMLAKKPTLFYDHQGTSRFGIFPRYHPEEIQWFETKSCYIFHTANTWDVTIGSGEKERKLVNMLACRLTPATILYHAGNITVPQIKHITDEEEEQCRLYFYQFELTSAKVDGVISQQYALSALNVEFPIIRDDRSMSAVRYVYCCSASGAPAGAALDATAKTDTLAKFDVDTLIARGTRSPPSPVTGCVDTRSIAEVSNSTDPDDPIKVFQMPPGWYTGERRFVPRQDGVAEHDGWLLAYAFNEAQLDENGEATLEAKSELWIIDALTMANVVGRVHLPQRVPYGFHGCWFSEEEISDQRSLTRIRSCHLDHGLCMEESQSWGPWMSVRRWLQRSLG